MSWSRMMSPSSAWPVMRATCRAVSSSDQSSGSMDHRMVGALRERLEALIGHDSLVLRPPYGMVNAAVRRQAGAPIILWSIDPEDWSDEDTARQVALITGQAEDGDIILLHDIYPSSVETALEVVDALHEEGFYFVTVDELFAAKRIELKPGESYTCARDATTGGMQAERGEK